MPNLIERRRMKRRLVTVGQQPVYNIYYTDTLPIRELPNLTKNLVQSFPQINQTIYPTPRVQDFLTRDRNNENNLSTKNMPYFPEEDQRRYRSMCFNDQSMKTRKSDFLDRQRSLPQNLCDYRSSPHRDNYAITSESRRSFDRINSTNPHITLPAQPVGSNQGYTMKIQVLTKPLKTGNFAEKTLPMENLALTSQERNDSDENFSKIQESCGTESMERRNRMFFHSNEEKKRGSILSKIKRKINRRVSRSRDNDPEESTRTNSAMEILSPRQLLESTTNVCSSIETSEIEPDRSTVVATNFQEALKNLEDTLKIDVPEQSKFFRIPNSEFPSSSMSFVCNSCKLKSHNDIDDRSSLGRIRNSRGSYCETYRGVGTNSCDLWKTLYPNETLENSLPEVNYNVRRAREGSRDHSPPERDRPERSLRRVTNSRVTIDCREHAKGCCHPDGNLACCGLVMYGQKDSIFKYDQRLKAIREWLFFYA